MLKKAFLAFFNAGSRKCDFRLPHVFDDSPSLKTAVHPFNAAQAAEKRCFSTACYTAFTPGNGAPSPPLRALGHNLAIVDPATVCLVFNRRAPVHGKASPPGCQLRR
ncbi:MAG TPA: hypothetical protein ENK54_02410 [Thiotrichales bacterium]|nr:hypothetical protein [Thiotrichales bacterium]